MRRSFLLLCRLARRDVAPRPHDLKLFAVNAADQMLLVVHPAIGAVLVTKPILDSVNPIVEECRYSLLNADQIAGVDPVAPERRIR
jgi:hypothetical protein